MLSNLFKLKIIYNSHTFFLILGNIISNSHFPADYAKIIQFLRDPQYTTRRTIHPAYSRNQLIHCNARPRLLILMLNWTRGWLMIKKLGFIVEFSE